MLVLGAAGGVGLAAIQIGKVCGATVIAVARYLDYHCLWACLRYLTPFSLINTVNLYVYAFCFWIGRGAEKIQFLKSMGVDHVVDLSNENLTLSVKEFLKSRKLKGVDVLYDPVGGKLTKECMKLLNWGAHILVIGFASGEIPVIPANIALVKVMIPNVALFFPV